MGDILRSRMGRACAAGGFAVLECGPIQLRRQVDVWGSMRPEWKFTHGIRRTFDPALILNRGRYVGGVSSARFERIVAGERGPLRSLRLLPPGLPHLQRTGHRG